MGYGGILPRQMSLFSCKTTWPKQICRAAVYAILLWADCFWFCPAQQRGPTSKYLKSDMALLASPFCPRQQPWTHLSTPSHPDIFLLLQLKKKYFFSFSKKKKGLSVFFHTARVPLCRRRKLLIFSFQNYKQANRINPLKKILIFFKNWLIFNSKEF